MIVSVCLSVCPSSVREHIVYSNYTSELNQFFVHVTYGRDSVLLWRRCGTLCTSGLIDDVMLAHE